MNHLNEFNRAWVTPHFTKIALDPTDINSVLKERYSSQFELSMTKAQLWDMEVKKASRPDLFIPSVIKPGSVAAWGFKKEGNTETFTRVSEQRLWIDNAQYSKVIENVHIDHNTKVVTFIGLPQATSTKHGAFTASNAQPIFHVQHGVTGSENSPRNTWKIVHLAPDSDKKLSARFQRMNAQVWLHEYVEIYLRDIVGAEFSRSGTGKPQ